MSESGLFFYYQYKTEHTVRHKVAGVLALNYQVCGHSVITGAPKIWTDFNKSCMGFLISLVTQHVEKALGMCLKHHCILQTNVSHTHSHSFGCYLKIPFYLMLGFDSWIHFSCNLYPTWKKIIILKKMCWITSILPFGRKHLGTWIYLILSCDFTWHYRTMRRHTEKKFCVLNLLVLATRRLPFQLCFSYYY